MVPGADARLAGRYRLCRPLAAGGMGQVWRAVDQVLARPVAVKLLREESADDGAFVSRPTTARTRPQPGRLGAPVHRAA